MNPQQVECLTDFTLYIADKKKSKSKNKVWVPIIPNKPFLISLIASSIKGDRFCKFPEGSVTIPRVPGFQSKLPHILNNEDDFAFWIKTLADLGRLDASLTLSMVNPKKDEAQARQAGLLAKEKLRADAAKEAAAARLLDPDADSNDPPDNEDEMDLDSLELFMRQIYKKHPCNALYDQHLPQEPQKFHFNH
ncbi:hypothetical protein VP01_1203g4 [Puccinia sorghi]|uniref:Uncharacterized protein n=1 Tax=Puccinia sorghi TaxID=27349 RepID=A0A0L6VRX8_9BASI|nr:hypothetical protein VP01_1203g4 [Puccinia sorghi]